jgi:uncharacterized protein (DUF169 family)
MNGQSGLLSGEQEGNMEIFTRREALKIGIGTVALGASGEAISIAQTAQKTIPGEGNPAPALDVFKKYGEELETALLLRTSPVAVKMLEKEADIPKEAFHPKKDGGCHIAQCQAFGMSRREGKTVAMLKEDHWCPTAMMAYGMAGTPPSMAKLGESYQSFEVGKYIGALTAPLKRASFTPDVVLIYLNPAQLRGLLMPMMMGGASPINTHLLLPSCAHCVVDPMKTGQYTLVLPDPGEYQRALTSEEEMIFAVPNGKMAGLMASLKPGGRLYSFRDQQYMSMHPDFEQPQFYKDLFNGWGLGSK